MGHLPNRTQSEFSKFKASLALALIILVSFINTHTHTHTHTPFLSQPYRNIRVWITVLQTVYMWRQCVMSDGQRNTTAVNLQGFGVCDVGNMKAWRNTHCPRRSLTVIRLSLALETRTPAEHTRHWVVQPRCPCRLTDVIRCFIMAFYYAQDFYFDITF